MPHHRSLSLRTFVRSIPWDVFQAYFDQLAIGQSPSGWEFINAVAMQRFLDDPKNDATGAAIREDFRRINDLCGKGMSLVTRAYNRNGIPMAPNTNALELAMRLYLEHRDAFDYAWSRYLLLYGSASKLTFHHVEARKLVVQPDHVQHLKTELTEWFSSLAKGDVCNVQHFEDQGQHVFLISRGSYLRTVAHWQGDHVAFTSFRPASEDVLVFDPVDCQLTIKASIAKERSRYLKAFATYIVEDESLVEATASAPMFTLIPFQNGSFDFRGDGDITGITLVRMRMRLPGRDAPTFELRSEDVPQTLRSQFNGFGLDHGELTSVELCFSVRPKGERPLKVNVEIEPPSRTDLVHKRYNDIIERYLRDQRVKIL